MRDCDFMEDVVVPFILISISKFIFLFYKTWNQSENHVSTLENALLFSNFWTSPGKSLKATFNKSKLYSNLYKRMKEQTFGLDNPSIVLRSRKK